MNKKQKKANLNDRVLKNLFKINKKGAKDSKLLQTSSQSISPMGALSLDPTGNFRSRTMTVLKWGMGCQNTPSAHV